MGGSFAHFWRVMQKRKLGIIADCIINQSPVSTLKIIKDAGFDCFFTHHTDEPTIAALKQESDALGLQFEFIHGPYHGCNVMWEDGDAYRPFLNDILRTLRLAKKYNVATVIVHVSSGWTPPPVTEKGLQRFDEIVETAKACGVNVAFENLRRLDNFSIVMERYKNRQNVAFCYDVGHEHCYTRNVDFLDYFGDRLLCTHIHDNLGFEGNKYGNDDMHVLPFDGDIDFQKVMNKINAVGYTGSLMLEAFNGSPYKEDGFAAYKNLTAKQFVDLAFERVNTLSEM